jgi:glycerol-3-phosphate dehydrogenase (NAD(P)+)
MSPQSRNRHVEEQLGGGRPLEEILGEMNMVAEGVKTAELVLELAERHGVPVPISQQAHQVVIGAVTPLRAYSGLMYPPSSEAEPG